MTEKELLDKIHEDLKRYRRDKAIYVLFEHTKPVDYYTSVKKRPRLKEGQRFQVMTLRELTRSVYLRNRHLVDSIQSLFEMTGWTISTFADYFHIPHRTVEDWLYGKRELKRYWLELMYYKLSHELFDAPVGKEMQDYADQEL